MKQPVFLAHRGAFLPGRRENTSAAIERAVASGRFAYIEMDVRRTRSDDQGNQTAVLFHDLTLDRLYHQYRIPIAKRHRSGQKIANLTIDIIRGEEIEIVTLAEAMRIANGTPINIDLKSREAIEPMLDTIHDMVRKYKEWEYEKIVISSFNWKILAEIKRRERRLGIAMLYSWRNLPRGFGRTYHRLGARWISFNKYFAPVASPLAHLLGIPHRAVYVVNHAWEIRFLQLFGVEMFFTDVVTLPDMVE